jgi:LmbE family N-acetylglucosaminyl deacetylase
MTDLSVLACYAHPDDEQGITGFLRRSVLAGLRTGLICATRGEVGEIADPALATKETLGAVREQELRDAAAVIGIGDLWFLDYRDSGMRGTAENADPRAFVNAEANEAIARIVGIVRKFRPTIMITFDQSGGYGHPDHIAIHEWATRAFHAAGDAAQYPEAGAPFTPQRLYYASIPRTMIQMVSGMMAEQGVPSIFVGVDINQMGLPDEEITHRIDVAEFVKLKRQSLENHRTQMNPNSIMTKMPQEMWDAWRGTEVYAFVAGQPLPAEHDGQDLFVGLR